MDTIVPGGQQGYIDPTDGAFSFSIPHSFPPQGAILTGFTYTPQTTPNTVGTLSFGTDGQGFFACPTGNATTEGFPFQVFALAPGVADPSCIGIEVVTATLTEAGSAAFEYD